MLHAWPRNVRRVPREGTESGKLAGKRLGIVSSGVKRSLGSVLRCEVRGSFVVEKIAVGMRVVPWMMSEWNVSEESEVLVSSESGSSQGMVLCCAVRGVCVDEKIAVGMRVERGAPWMKKSVAMWRGRKGGWGVGNAVRAVEGTWCKELMSALTLKRSWRAIVYGAALELRKRAGVG